jgi:hypothetical protein
MDSNTHGIPTKHSHIRLALGFTSLIKSKIRHALCALSAILSILSLMAVAKPLIPTSTSLLASSSYLRSSFISNLRPLLSSCDDKAESKACSEASYHSFCATHPSGDSSDKAPATTLSCNPHTFVNSQDRHVKAMIFLTGILSLPQSAGRVPFIEAVYNHTVGLVLCPNTGGIALRKHSAACNNHQIMRWCL